jgi:hypothetical protein
MIERKRDRMAESKRRDWSEASFFQSGVSVQWNRGKVYEFGGPSCGGTVRSNRSTVLESSDIDTPMAGCCARKNRSLGKGLAI